MKVTIQDLSKDGKVTELESLLKDVKDINSIDEYGHTALHSAIFRGLLKQGLDVPEDILKAQQQVVKVLLHNGIDVNKKDRYYGRTAIYGVSFIGDIKIVRLLIKNGASPNIQNNDGRTSLHSATLRMNNLELVKELVAIGADITIKDNRGATALEYAKMYNFSHYITFYEKVNTVVDATINDDKDAILKLFGNENEWDREILERVALKRAIEDDNINLANDILANKGNINKVSKDGYTLLHFAVLSNNEKLVRYLLKNGAKSYVLEKEGNTAIHLACFSNNKAILNILANRTTTDVLMYQNKDGLTAKEIAVLKNNNDIVKSMNSRERETIVRDIISLKGRSLV